MKYEFQTEINKLLHLIIHSLYSNKDIFLRELISNASDAIDKLNYLTLSDDKYKSLSFDSKIEVGFTDTTIFVKDNGIGLNKEDMISNLGTIAKSGTADFLKNIENAKNNNLIGQFGVGFYACFMVAKKVEVISKKAQEDNLYLWSSDGSGEFEIEELDKTDSRFTQDHGTFIIVYLKEEEDEYKSIYKIESIIKKYSDHIAYPIFSDYDQEKYDDQGKSTGKEKIIKQLNDANALWKRARNELKEEDYNNFYKNNFSDQEDPLLSIHTKAEGNLEYTTLFYIPKKAAYDVFYSNYQSFVRLYVKRVFITEDDKELLPRFLRFVKGIIDSEDIPLNVSREILQKNIILQKIKQISTKKILNEIKNFSKKEEEKEKYNTFIDEYNKVLKEGLAGFSGESDHKDELLEIIRFKTTKNANWTSLEEYTNRMQKDQKAIYYISGTDEKTLKGSPLLEGYRKKDIEILICSDEIDDFYMPMLGKYKEIDIKAINKEDEADNDNQEIKDKQEEFQTVINKIKNALGSRVKDVKITSKLEESPSCIIIGKEDMTYAMQNVMKAMSPGVVNEVNPILEINPNHNIIKKMKDINDFEILKDYSNILLNQAFLAEGIPLSEPQDFVKSLNRIIEN